MNEPLGPDELANILRREYDAANDYFDQIEPLQEAAFRFYEAQPFGNEVPGRSQIVLPDVQETCDYMNQSVLRTFLSGDRVIELEATDEADEQAADDATAAIDYRFMREQDGARVLGDIVQDGNLKMYGVFKALCDYEEKVSRRWEVMPLDALGLLPDDLEIEQVREYPETGEARVLIKTQKSEKKHKLVAVPVTEFRFSADAKHEDEADYLAHVRKVNRSELVAMGFDADQVYDLPTHSKWQDTESDTRDYQTEDWSSAALEEVLLCEEYARIDVDGDGIAERVKSYRVENEILRWADPDKEPVETVDEQPFSVFCPFPRPHRLVGYALSQKVMDIQYARSEMARQLFDGMAYANMPRPIVSESGSSDETLDDLLHPIPGSPIRVRDMSAVSMAANTFDVGKSLQAMEWMTGERESRTGITRMNQGLDADTLNKMLCIETPVPMADGSYKRLGDVRDGDWLIGGDGEPVYTIRAHKIHDPEKAYRITFASGEQVDAGGEHLWTVQTDNDKRYNKRQTIDTDRLFALMQQKGRVYVPRVVRPFTGAHAELPLDPYMLGTWLGDGGSYAPRITTMESETVEFAEAWAEPYGGLTLDKQQNSGRAKSYYVKGLYPILRQMRQLKRGGEGRDDAIIGKHIPEEYFAASYHQRLELLRGLMDTDGCHHSNALCVFVQKGGRLLDDFVRLVESLGGWPSVRPASADGAFQVTFSLADCPFRLSRKAKDWVAPKANATTQVIRAIERIAIKPMRCLTVAAEDGLFCVGRRFTVTHNTATGTALMQAAGQLFEEAIAYQMASAFARAAMKLYRMMRVEAEPFNIMVDGKPRQVDPSTWPESMNVRIRVGLGTNSKDKRIQARMALQEPLVLLKQEGLAGPEHIFKWVDGVARDMGIGQGDDFMFNPADPEVQQRLAQQAEQPDPEVAAKQAEMQAKQQEAQARLQLDAQKAEASAMLDREKAQAQIETDREKHAMQMQVTREKAALDSQLARDKAAEEIALSRERMAAEIQLQRERNAREAELSQNRSGGSLAE